MKTNRPAFVVLMLTTIVLVSIFDVRGQENTAVDNTRNNINTIKNKASDAYTLTEKIAAATSLTDITTIANQAAANLNEAINAVKNAESSVVLIAIPANNFKYQRLIQNITNEIEDVKNKVNYANRQSLKASQADELEEAKKYAQDVIYELKKLEKVTAEIEVQFIEAQQALTVVD